MEGSKFGILSSSIWFSYTMSDNLLSTSVLLARATFNGDVSQWDVGKVSTMIKVAL